MRADKKRNIAKVAKSILKNPLKTQREIANELNISVWNVNDKLNKLEQEAKKDDRIIGITDKDIENIIKMQQVISEKIDDKKEMSQTRIWELAQAMREATARYSLFRGNATDSQGGLRFPEITEEQMDKIAKRFKKYE